jgi:phage tail-like protein
MRGAIEGLESPHPIGGFLPGVYHGDDFAQRFCGGLDCVLAPIFASIDAHDAYFDPSLAPEDFLQWLAGWVGVAVDQTWPLERQRELVAHSCELYSWRGTSRGIAAHLALYTGAVPEVADSGGSVWSPTPGGELPGRAAPSLTIRLHAGDNPGIDLRRVDGIVLAIKPAHIPHRIVVVAE